ncbi:phosphoglycerate mutase [Tremella mesenterica]|uniref:Phosphoglycerate mutase n=1 Tax=Tremella mesenterica TaxID=5217 RepID=A0A4Q1BK26_TREME|nr:phosphoglycerate mutase [Tremella mesenterica]
MTRPLEDDPAIAAIDDGGPAVDPGLLVERQKFNYEVIQGYFLQNGPKPKHLTFNEVLKRSFGLIDTSEDRWTNLKSSISKLQSNAPPGVSYKLLFIARHGQGWHNFGASKYGAEAWEAHWTFITGDGVLNWGPDPELTPLGVSQARAIQKAWKREKPLGAPVSHEEMRWYVSPLTRTGQTMIESWGDLLGVPEVWEDWREIYGSHTCDKRSSKSTIRKRFPHFIIEPSLAEEDELWRADYREDDKHMQERATRALDRLFGPEGAKETYISITSHSAFLRNLLAILRHQPYPLATGEMIPVVVKATAIDSTSSFKHDSLIEENVTSIQHSSPSFSHDSSLDTHDSSTIGSHDSTIDKNDLSISIDENDSSIETHDIPLDNHDSSHKIKNTTSTFDSPNNVESDLI